MKITKDNLLSSDYDTLFTHDPGTFIEAIIINLLWANKAEDSAAVIERQRFVFEQWLEYYTANVQAEMITEKQPVQDSYQKGYIDGQVDALTNLPMKKSLLTQYVDLIKVADMLHQLKASQPEARL